MASKSWRDIQNERSKRTPEEREATKARALHHLAVERKTLAQVRRARTMTQATLAETMDMAQGDVSRLEHRTDAYIGTIRRYIEALGGELHIVAAFPNDEAVEIAGFGGLDSAPVGVVRRGKDQLARGTTARSKRRKYGAAVATSAKTSA